MRRVLAVLVLTLMAVVSGACDNNSTGVEAGDNRSADSEDAGAGEGGADSEDTGGDSGETEPAGGEEEFSGRGSGDFCETARRFQEEFEDLGTEQPASADEYRALYEDIGDAIDELVADAPGEIEADAETVQANFRKVKEILERYDYDFSKIPPEESEAMNDPEVDAANQRLDAYLQQVCNIAG